MSRYRLNICQPSSTILFAHPVNLKCPLPKIANSVNYFGQRKFSTTIIKIRQDFFFFFKIDQPERRNPTPRIGDFSVLYWNLIISKFVGQYQHTVFNKILRDV